MPLKLLHCRHFLSSRQYLSVGAQHCSKCRDMIFVNLAAQVCRTLHFITDTLRDKDAQTSKRLAADLTYLQEIIGNIHLLVETQQSRSYIGSFFYFFFSTRADVAQAKQYSLQLESALEFFSLKSTVQIRAGIQDLRRVIVDLKKDVAALKIHPISSPSTASLQVLKHTRRKSDICHKSNDNSKANRDDLTRNPAKPPYTISVTNQS